MGRTDDRAAETAALGILSAGPAQGYDVCARLTNSCALSHAAAYSVLYTLEARGLIEAKVEVSGEGDERRWYSLTGAGERHAAKTRANKESIPSAALAAGVIA